MPRPPKGAVILVMSESGIGHIAAREQLLADYPDYLRNQIVGIIVDNLYMSASSCLFSFPLPIRMKLDY